MAEPMPSSARDKKDRILENRPFRLKYSSGRNRMKKLRFANCRKRVAM